jgi:predicted DNA binding CopG/RHH family protein
MDTRTTCRFARADLGALTRRATRNPATTTDKSHPTHLERDYTMSSVTSNAKTTGLRKPRTKNTAEPITRLNVNLNAETAEALKEIAEHRGISFTEAVRRAISVYKFIDDETQEGHRIQTVDPERNQVRELVLM